MAIRKDANTLSPTERAELVDAFLELKRTGIYDQFVLRHANAPMSNIHRCPAFLPWHRRFLWDLEQELQRVSGNNNLGIPYWNWPSGAENASIWDDNLMGGDGDAFSQFVLTGPFRQGQWEVVNSSGNSAGPLTRAFGRSGLSTLPTQVEIDQVMAVTPYDSQPWGADPAAAGFRAELEGFRGPNLHNRGHVWVGGSMLPMTSPNDPVFFLHHCMVDKVWHDWQQRFPNQGYLPVTGGPFGQNLTDPMDATPNAAIGSRPIDVLDSGAIGIIYDGAVTPPQPAEVLLTVDAAPADAAISAPAELDRFRFEVDSFDNMIIETSGSSDTFMTLFGPNDPNREITSNDDGGANFNARITQQLSAGSYFVQLRLFDPAQTGNYRIQVRKEVSTAVIPEIAINAAPLNAAISARQESDLYRFNATSSGNYTIETLGSTDMFLTVFGPNSQTTQIGSDDDSGSGRNSRLRLDLQPGNYYARVRHFSPDSTGAYQIQVSSDSGSPNTPVIPDIELNAPPVQADISAPRETDLYRLTVTIAGRYTIETLGSTDMFLTLMNPQDDPPQIATDDDSGAGLNPRLVINLQPATYFVSVRHFSADAIGAYQIQAFSS